MSNRYLGGLVRGIPLQFTPQQGNAANGVFTMTQYMQAIKARTWPIYDPYYGYNVLLLHGNGTNGAQNNTFLDSSTNNFTITRNGNTTQGTFSPFTEPAGRWGVVFPLSDADVRYTSNLNPGASDFTMEFWVIPFSTSTTMINWGQNSGSNAPGIGIGGSGNQVNFTVRSSAGTHTGSTTISLSYTTWSHLALVRNGTSLVLYVNGVASSTATITAGATVNAGLWYCIGILVYGGTIPRYRGYMSNFRLNFNAVYTSNFTPPTEPLSVTANTQLLLFQTTQPTKDGAGNTYTFANNAGYELTPINPFPALFPYTPAVNGGSGYFDGNGDSLTLTGAAIGSGNFTIEFWVNPAQLLSNAAFLDISSSASSGLLIRQNTAGILVRNRTTSSDLFTTTTGLFVGSWTHFALVRNSGSISLYTNGVLSGSVSNSTNFTDTAYYICRFFDTTGAPFQLNGYLSNLRITNTAVYTSAFTPPTAPLTAISGTSFLLNFTNAGVIDNTGINNPETVADAQIDTSVKIMGDGSLKFDGTGDWLRIPDNRNLQLRVSNFTIECWVYLNAIGTARGVVAKGGASTGWLLSITNTNLVQFTHTTTTITSVSSLAASTWYHIAVVREGLSTNQTKIYINGVQDGQGTVGTDFSQTEPMYVGANRTAGDAFNGYIDDLRISRYARYTGSLIPVPNEPFPLNGEPYPTATTLLIPGTGTNGAQNNTFLDSSTNNFTITRNGNTTQGTFTPFSRDPGYWSNFFDGTGDYLATSSTSAVFDMSTGDFTMEAWIYIPTVPAAYTVIMSGASTAGVSGGFVFGLDNTGKPYIGNGVVLGISGATAVQANTWVHVAAVKSGANVQFYTNGTANGSAQAFSPNAAGFAYVGANPAGNERITGYISNARIVKGTAVYTSAFTPPTAPLTNITNTSLLTCQSNRFVDNSTNNFTITRNGDVRVTTFQPFTNPVTYSAAVNGGSGYFDGSGDYLSVPASAQFLPGANTDFTFEAWVYLTATPGAQGAQIVGTGEYGLNSDWSISVNSSRLPIFYINVPPGGLSVTSSTAINLFSWNHIAVTRSGTSTNNLKMFLNGVNVGQTSTNITLDYTGNNLTLGADENGDEAVLTGYISGLRLINGTGYTSITTPTAPPTAITNTVLLTNFTNGSIYDASMTSDIETAGNAQISTAVSKFQGSSMYFDGTGDGLKIASTPDLSFGTGNFTIQFWVNITSFAANRTLFDIGNATVMQIYVTTTGSLRFYAASADRITSSANLELGTWYYIAVTRSSGITRMFVNGTQTGVAYTDSNNYAAGGVGIGARFDVTLGLLGYMSNVRVLKGTALPLTTQFQTSQWQDV